jgi:hypothetical protein
MSKTAKAIMRWDLGNVQSAVLIGVGIGFLALLAYLSLLPT